MLWWHWKHAGGEVYALKRKAALSPYSYIMQDIFVIDDFYPDPYRVREFARNLDYSIKFPSPDWRADGIENLWPGLVATEVLKENQLDVRISKILNVPVRSGLKSGFFRLSKITDTYDAYAHTDGIPDKTNKKNYQGVVYLSPDTYCSNKIGTVFLKHIPTGMVKLKTANDYWRVLPDYTKPDQWEVYKHVENKFNRLVIFDNTYFHGPGDLFGTSFEDARLAQIFNFHEI